MVGGVLVAPGSAAAPAAVPLGRGAWLVDAGVRVVLGAAVVLELGWGAAGALDAVVLGAELVVLGSVLADGSAEDVGDGLVSTTVGSGDAGALGSSWAAAVLALPSSKASTTATPARMRVTGSPLRCASSGP